jgi:hypothetical protein
MGMFSMWPVIAAALASVLVGYVWYHPKLFGALWMREAGITPEMAEHGARYRHVHLAIGFCLAFVTAFVVQYLMSQLEVHSLLDACAFAFFVWIGFVVPVSAAAFLWEHRSITFYILNISYWFVASVIMCVILVI